MDFDITQLPDDPVFLKRMLADFHGQIIDLKKDFDRETGILLDQIKLLRQQQFGRSSEKTDNIPSNVHIKPLFDMPEPEKVPGEEQEEKISVPAHTRKKAGRKPLPEDLPRVEVLHDISEEEKVCDCGCRMKRIGEEVSEQLDIIPARIQVIRHVRPKYACSKCEGEESSKPAVRIAPVESQILPKSMATSGLAAYILMSKFVDHLPFYRQEKQFARIGVDISRSSMCSWSMKVAEQCRPILNLLQDELLSGFYVNVDETTLQVLKEKGRSPTSKSYMWVFRRGDPDNPVLIYKYAETRSGDIAVEFLRGFEGYVQTDGYSGYIFLDSQKGVIHVGCWAHARRKFTEVVKAQGKKSKKSGSAHIGLKYVRELYKLEKAAKVKGLSPEEIYAMRQEKARPILEDFKKWLEKRLPQTPPKGLLGQAIAYCLNHWNALMAYLKDGHLAMDNNAAENAIRPFVVGRKNWLFSGTPEGAEASAMFYSLIETAKANGLEPYSYLRHLFEKLPFAKKLEDYETLLPWNLNAKELIAAVVNYGDH